MGGRAGREWRAREGDFFYKSSKSLKKIGGGGGGGRGRGMGGGRGQE